MGRRPTLGRDGAWLTPSSVTSWVRTGPNLTLLREVCGHTGAPVVASGGVSSLADLRALAGLEPAGVEGAIVGKALYAGAFTIAEALACLRTAEPSGHAARADAAGGGETP